MENTLSYAQQQDANDSLRAYRDRFFLPTFHENQVRYFTGNSLGLQPKTAGSYIQQELDDWAKWGVEGHFHGKRPWFSYHENLTYEKVDALLENYKSESKRKSYTDLDYKNTL